MTHYDLTNVSINERLSEETVCISADLRNSDSGEIVAKISNRGTGGETDLYTVPGASVTRSDIERDLADQYGEFGLDTLVERTALIEQLARKRRAVFILPDDGDPFETGQIREVSGDRTSSLAMLRVKYPQALVFDKSQRSFIPVASAR